MRLSGTAGASRSLSCALARAVRTAAAGRPVRPGRRAAGASLVVLPRGPLLARDHDGEGRGRPRNLAALQLHDAEQVSLRPGPWVVGGEHVRGGPLRLRLQDRSLALQVEVLQEQVLVVGEVIQRDQQPRLLVVVVVPLRPPRLRKRRVLLVPGARGLVRAERALDRVGAAVAERLVQPADAVVRRGDEHQITGRPGVECAVREHARHAELGHLRDVVPADHLPLVGEDRIQPRVVRPVADRVVVQVRHRLVQIVEHLRLPPDVGVQHVARQVQRQRHRVAVVVVGDVLAPVDVRRPVLARVRQMPAVDVDLAVAAVDLDDRRDQRDDPVADLLDVRALVDGEAIDELHQRRRRARLGRVDRAGDVVHRHRLIDQRVRLGVVHADRAGIGQLGEPGAVLVELREFASDDTATAIISRPSSVFPIEYTFTRGLAFSTIRMYW